MKTELHKIAAFYRHLWNDPLTLHNQVEVCIFIVVPLMVAGCLMYWLIVRAMRAMGWRV